MSIHSVTLDRCMMPPLPSDWSGPAPIAAPTAADGEAALLRRLAEGDVAALDEVWAAWNRPLFAYAWRALGSVEDAEEVLQDALVKFWEKAAGYDRDKARPFSWALMITRGLVCDRLRLRQRRPVLVSESATTTDPAAPPAVPGTRSDLQRALSALTAEEREALDFALFQPTTHEDLAARLGQPLGTVKARLRRAVHKLRAALAEEESAP